MKLRLMKSNSGLRVIMNFPVCLLMYVANKKVHKYEMSECFVNKFEEIVTKQLPPKCCREQYVPHEHVVEMNANWKAKLNSFVPMIITYCVDLESI